MFVAGFLANGNDNLYTKHELFQILSDETDDLQTGMLDLGDGHKIQAKFTTLDNSEWRRVIAEYEIEHGLPVSVYSKDLNLPDQEARRRIEENPNASCLLKSSQSPLRPLTEEEKIRLRPHLDKAKTLTQRKITLLTQGKPPASGLQGVKPTSGQKYRSSSPADKPEPKTGTG